MIKENELRIGNLVECSGDVSKITSIHSVFTSTNKYAADLLINNDIYVQSALLDDINPIPLTHDWIRKLGFNTNPSGWSKSGFWLLRHKGEFVFGIQARLVSYKAIKHVHQLQNLYFAVLCEELTLTELA